MGVSSSWLWLSGVCLFINVGLIFTLFAFHASWMPKQISMVKRAQLRNRKQLWRLMAGKDVEGGDVPGGDAEEVIGDNMEGGGSASSSSGVVADFPYSVGNSPNNEDYDIEKQEYHVIFSTGCSDKQHWQSYMLFYSMVTSEQTGQVTRIASGCSEEETKQLEIIHREQIEPMGMDMPYKGRSRFNLHMTPEFGEGFHYNK